MKKTRWLGKCLVLISLAIPYLAQSQEFLDQQQTVYTGGMSARNLPGYSYWQSFAAGLNGDLSHVDMLFFTPMSGTGTLRFYAGDGTNGLQLQAVPVPVFCVGNSTWDSWAVHAPVVAGQSYTMELSVDPNVPDPYGVAVGMNNPYPGGVLGINDPSGTTRTDMDMCFRTYVTVPEPPAFLLAFGIAAYLIVQRARLRTH